MAVNIIWKLKALDIICLIRYLKRFIFYTYWDKYVPQTVNVDYNCTYNSFFREAALAKLKLIPRFQSSCYFRVQSNF